MPLIKTIKFKCLFYSEFKINISAYKIKRPKQVSDTLIFVEVINQTIIAHPTYLADKSSIGGDVSDILKPFRMFKPKKLYPNKLSKLLTQ